MENNGSEIDLSPFQRYWNKSQRDEFHRQVEEEEKKLWTTAKQESKKEALALKTVLVERLTNIYTEYLVRAFQKGFQRYAAENMVGQGEVQECNPNRSARTGELTTSTAGKSTVHKIKSVVAKFGNVVSSKRTWWIAEIVATVLLRAFFLSAIGHGFRDEYDRFVPEWETVVRIFSLLCTLKFGGWFFTFLSASGAAGLVLPVSSLAASGGFFAVLQKLMEHKQDLLSLLSKTISDAGSGATSAPMTAGPGSVQSKSDVFFFGIHLFLASVQEIDELGLAAHTTDSGFIAAAKEGVCPMSAEAMTTGKLTLLKTNPIDPLFAGVDREGTRFFSTNGTAMDENKKSHKSDVQNKQPGTAQTEASDCQNELILKDREATNGFARRVMESAQIGMVEYVAAHMLEMENRDDSKGDGSVGLKAKRLTWQVEKYIPSWRRRR